MRLANVFFKHQDRFSVYGMYCANLTKAIMILQELCDTDPAFKEMVNVSMYDHFLRTWSTKTV